MPIEQFSINFRKQSGLPWFCSSLLCGWFRKLTPPFRPIRSRTETNRDLVTCVFPAFNKFSCFYSEFSMAPFDILYRSALRLAAVITLVLGLRHSIEYALKAQVLIILVLGEYSPSAVSFRWYCFAIQFRWRWYFCLVSHVVEHRTAVRKVESLSSRSDQHSVS